MFDMILKTLCDDDDDDDADAAENSCNGDTTEEISKPSNTYRNVEKAQPLQLNKHDLQRRVSSKMLLLCLLLLFFTAWFTHNSFSFSFFLKKK